MFVNDSYALEKRVALVIGNSNYSTSPLKNPVNDASDIAALLEKLDFHVDVALDLSRKEIRQKIRDFGQKLTQADVGFFYFAGHGIQYEGVNYLIPVNADMTSEDEIVDEAIATSSILKKMESAGNGINIVVLDACRNNPFARSFRSSTQGLASIDAPAGSFIAYATAPGSVAADGTGKNGLYTQYLLQTLDKPGLAIEQVFKKVRVSVVQDTDGRQVPWENSSLLGDFHFVEPLESVPTFVTKDDSSNQFELDFWQTVQKEPSREMYTAYIKKFPKGLFSPIAREKLKLMGNGMITVRSNVFGDSIKIDGEFRGTSKLTLSLEPGKHTIEVSKQGFKTITKDINVVSEKHLALQFTLQAESGDNQARSHAAKDDVKTDVKVRLPEPELVLAPVIEEPDIIVNGNKNLDDNISPAAINERIEPVIAMPFVEVKSGCFTMGSPFLEEGRLHDENEHKVCLTKDFWISKHEVTQAQWQKVMGYNPSFFKGCGRNCPVERVSWDEVQGFIFKLNLHTGQKYRLPTEAEWEYAARAGTASSTYIGDIELLGQNNTTDLDKIAWYSGNSGVKYKGGRYCEDWDEKQYRATRCGTNPVALKQPNPWRLYDMIGNVWEWTQDIYGSLSSREVTDPTGADKGNKRVVKGGNWQDSLSQNRAAARYAFTQNKKLAHVGFRLVRTSE